ncbi:TlpA family protein disulfide reductase [Allorhizocola rhizosphaerae]|uniref:TlpA family protein disulfide reductase n=1 Tax=Allorhizocola rhizosphaerae TaxID=1872709 RepID=UPI000E3DFF10|nr:thioredoxin family protein [Allorhizocola rhizosphaerae]
MQTAGLIVAVAVILAAAAFGVLRRARDGRVRAVSMSSPALEQLGVRPGQVTLVQFSSAFCAPCRTTRVVCAEVARTTPGVTHVEVDAESHLAQVRELGIRRTPTVLIVSPTGEVIRRAEGAPTLAQLRAALSALGRSASAPSV